MRVAVQIAIALFVSAPVIYSAGKADINQVREALVCRSSKTAPAKIVLAEQIGTHLGPTLGGTIDRIATHNGQVIVEGWAADLAVKDSAKSVQIVLNGKTVAAIHPVLRRPDVSKAMHLPCSDNLGFSVTLQAAATSDERISAFAELHNGSFAKLANSQD